MASTIAVETHGNPRKPIEEGATFTQTLSLHGVMASWRWDDYGNATPRAC